MNLRSFLFGSSPLEPTSADAARAVLRVVMGLSLALAHGLGKVPPKPGFVEMVGGMGMPAPVLFAWLAMLAEFAGGLLIAAGLLTRPAALFVVGHFVIVALLAHAGQPYGNREDAVLFGTMALFFAAAGAGRYSVDALLRRDALAR